MKPILVATDLSARSDRAVARAAALARASGAPLHLACVVDDDRPHDLVLSEEATARDALEAQAATLDGVTPTILVETGHAATLIPKLARDCDAGLVVTGGHRSRGLSDIIGRPNLARILMGLDRTALVVVGRPETPYGHILAATDFSPAGEAAARAAQALAPNARLTLGHVFVMPDMGMAQATHASAEFSQIEHDRQETALKEAAEAYGDPKPDTALRIGPAAPLLVRMATEASADLIAIGRHTRGPLARLLMGETALSVALSAPCDVLVTPPE